MSDIITGKIFVDGERGITATKMNQIISQAVIQPDFYQSKSSSSTIDSTDRLLELKGTGSYAQITGQQLIDSVSAQVNVTPTITSVRLRSYNAVGNPNFEIDQRAVGTMRSSATGGTFLADRWIMWKTGTMAVNLQRQPASSIVVPGTSFEITQNIGLIQLATQQTTLGSGDYVFLDQQVEGPPLRELINDVHSVSLLVYSTVAPLKFGFYIRGGSTSYAFNHLCTIPTASTWTLITIPNIPTFPSAASWSLAPGTAGYGIGICLAAGTANTAAANDVWAAGGFIGAAGQDNWCSKPTSSNFYVAFIQHEPGSQSTTLIDNPWTQNYQECQRYFTKSWPYASAIGSVSQAGAPMTSVPAFSQPWTWIPYPVRMAKTPTVTGYSTNGAINNVRDNQAGGDKVISGAANNGEGGYGGFSLSATNSAVTTYLWNYTADTAW